MVFTCSRCGVEAVGHEDADCTAGFYQVGQAPWDRFARAGETVLCEPCMWRDPIYAALYGNATVESIRYEPGRPTLEVMQEAADREFPAGRGRGL